MTNKISGNLERGTVATGLKPTRFRVDIANPYTLMAVQEAVRQFLNGGLWELLGTFQEVETGKGADALAKRPQLRAAHDA